MTEDVTDHLDRRAALYLTGRVRVAKDMCTEEVGMNARSTCISA